MTLREKLREAMIDCPACVPEDCDDLADADVPGWAASHGLTAEGLTPEDEAALRAAYTASDEPYPSR